MARSNHGSFTQRKVKGAGIGKEEYRYDVRLSGSLVKVRKNCRVKTTNVHRLSA